MATYTLCKDESKIWYMTSDSSAGLVKDMEDAVSVSDKESIVRDLLTWLEDNCDDNVISSIVTSSLARDWRYFVADVLLQMRFASERNGEVEVAGLIEVEA